MEVFTPQAYNPSTMDYEECTYGGRPFFTDEPVLIGPFTWYIDTVDVDGDLSHCRVHRHGESGKQIVPVEWLGKRDLALVEIDSYSLAYIRRLGGGHDEWRKDTWDVAQDNLRETFEALGFEVHVNGPAATVTIIERATTKALTIAPISNTSNGTVTGAEAL